MSEAGIHFVGGGTHREAISSLYAVTVSLISDIQKKEKRKEDLSIRINRRKEEMSKKQSEYNKLKAQYLIIKEQNETKNGLAAQVVLKKFFVFLRVKKEKEIKLHKHENYIENKKHQLELERYQLLSELYNGENLPVDIKEYLSKKIKERNEKLNEISDSNSLAILILNNKINSLKSDIAKINQNINEFKARIVGEKVENNYFIKHMVKKMSTPDSESTDADLEQSALISKLEEIDGSIKSINAELEQLMSEKQMAEQDAYNKEQVAMILKANRILGSKDLFNKAILFPMLEDIQKRYHVKKINYKLNLSYIALYLSYLYAGRLASSHKYIYIDEGQDISLNEYGLIKDIYHNNTFFNIYGDINQMINEDRGIREWNDLAKIYNAETYYLNENYRNTIEVTNYCAESLNIKATPIGLNGPNVKTMSRMIIYELLRMKTAISYQIKLISYWSKTQKA